MKIAIHKIVIAAITITIVSMSSNLLYGSEAASKTIGPSKVEAGSKDSRQPLTFCNPLNIEYRFTPGKPSRRMAADPVIVLFRDTYFLFSTGSSEYWHSSDLVNWILIPEEKSELPDHPTAPAVTVVGDEVELSALVGVFRQDTALCSCGLRPRDVGIVDEVHAGTAADLRCVVVAPVVDHVVDHVVKPASQPGTAIRVVGEKTVVNGDVVGAGAREPPHAVGRPSLGNDRPLDGNVPDLAPGVDDLVGGAHKRAVLHEHVLDRPPVHAPEQQAIARTTACGDPNTEMPDDDVLAITAEMNPVMQQGDALTGRGVAGKGHSALRYHQR